MGKCRFCGGETKPPNIACLSTPECRAKHAEFRAKVFKWALDTTEYGKRCPRSVFEEEMVGHEKDGDQ